MTDFAAHLALGLQAAAAPANILFCFVGVFLGTAIGVLPGLGPSAAIAVLLPITFYLEPLPALTMLAGIYYGSQYGGSTTSILVKVPGESASVVTCIDGHEMARRGRAGAALAIAAIGSFIAGCVGTALIIAFGPALASVVTAFGSPEYFALMVLGLLAVAATQGSLLGALAMVLLGTMLGLVGRDVNTGYPRFTFGLLSLSDGIGFVPLTIGLFGLAEIMHNLDDPEKRGGVQVRIGRLLPSREEWRRALPAILRGTGLGCFLGMLPGGGATLSSFASYALEKQISPRREEFGHGAVEGLAGPEAANNAGAQTAFIPLLTLGLPSNAVMALLVGGMMIHGIIPGPNVMADQPELFWGMVLSMFLGNALLVVINLPFVGLWVQFLRIPYRYLYPGIFLFCCIGVYSVNNNLFDVWLSLVFALLGYFLLKVRLDPTPLILGFVLGPILENNFRRTLMLSNGDFSIFLQRPVALFLLLTAAALVILPAILRRRHRRGTSN